jgi:hypothetical protein
MRRYLLVAGVIVLAIGVAIAAVAALAAAETGRFPRLGGGVGRQPRTS